MSKSNADFSAFDFNDSSDNSDIQPASRYLSRASLNASTNNVNSNASNNSRGSSSSSASGGNGSTNDEQQQQQHQQQQQQHQHQQQQQLQQNLNGNIAESIRGGIVSDGRRRRSCSQGEHDNENEQENENEHENDSDNDDDDDDDDEEEEEEDEEDEDDTTVTHKSSSANNNNNTNSTSNNKNNNNNNTTAHSSNKKKKTSLGADNLNTPNVSAVNNIDGLLIGAAAAADTTEVSGAGVGGVASAAPTGSSCNANALESNSNCPVVGLLDGALSAGSNCNEIARSSSASLSNSGPSTAGVGGSASDRRKYRHQNYSKNIYIGTKNAEKWEHTRTRLQFKNDVEFVAYLLNLADNDKERLANLPPPSAQTTPTKTFANNFKLEPNLSVKEFSNTPTENTTEAPVKRKYKKRVQFSDTLNGFPKMKDFSNFAMKAKKQDQKMKSNTSGNADTMLPEVLDCRIAEKIKSELEEKSASKVPAVPNALCLKKPDAQRSDDDDEDEEVGAAATATLTAVATPAVISGAADSIDGLNGQSSSSFRVRVKNKKQTKGMCPPNTFGSVTSGVEEDEEEVENTDDDEEDEEMDEEAMAREMKNEQNFVEEEDEHDIAFRSQQSCRECSITHDYKLCPLRNAVGNITDAVDLAEWIERKNLEALAKLKADAQRQAKQGHDDEDMDETSQMSELETKPLITFAEASVPAEFELHNVEPSVTGVFVRTEVRAFTKLGPIIGQPIETNDIREGSDMKWIFEICEPGAEKSQFLSCDNPNTSNWLRFMRPAPTYEERNVNLVSIDRQAYFVTCRDVRNGMELLYWSDECNTMWRKKHTEKTNCGGCNLKFEHPLYYRTHCSVFHDPSMSLTIRKYHCKVCGEAVLGKDNIMKHAAEVHEGKGAYQCQFCNKFFLRLNYLEMHRTYGCAANPNRARPLCDFCGRKFCQPQKLKAHIKRMHSDMAEVLRDFQCKLCSKLLGSRAALQRHSKEVHSRNSTVVSCPRCQKLFQNRSNLKIHMLTHSGVRPFKCAEPECNAAFTTKQCLQFHYKKVHNYTQEQMPKIERSVAYTFDAYSGGMKVDFLEQAPRRRRKSLEDQNSMLSSSIQSDTEFSDDNIFEAIKKSGKSIKDLCRNEPNLSLLSSKISSMFGAEKAVGSRKRKKKKDPLPSMLNEMDDEEERMEQVRRKQNAQLSLVESFLTTTAHRLTAQQQVQQVVAAAAAVSAMAGSATDDPNKMHMMSGLNPQHMGMGHPAGMENDDEEDDDEEDDHVGRQLSHDNNAYRHHAGMNSLGQNLVVSKGSKKWISGDERHLGRDCASVDRCSMGGNDVGSGGMNSNQGVCGMQGAGNAGDMGLSGFAVPPSAVDDPTKLIGQNRDFLARLMNSASANHGHHNPNNREDDENSSFLDVVESNNNGGGGQLPQYHHNGAANTADGGNGGNGVGPNVNGPVNNPGNQGEMHMNSLAHSQAFMSSFYSNANARLSGAGSNPSTSASMLVEAALNSVGNMMDSESNDLKVPTENNINTDSPMSAHVDTESNRFAASNAANAMNSMENLENELKMMKNLNNFPMQIPPLPIFPNSGNNMNSCDISPNASTPTNPQSNQNNEVEVDASSTPRPQQMGGGGAGDSDGFSSAHHRTPPSPQPISPGRDYSLFGATATPTNGTPGGPGTAGSSSSGNSGGGGNGGNNNISASSPLPTMHQQRRNASSVGSSYPEHELISPASSPSIPRYNFNGEMMRHKRAEHESERRQNMSAHHHLSSDEENSIMPQNSSGQDMRMKFSQSQMDLMYTKYESMANAQGLKYNQDMDSPVGEFRSSNSNASAVATNSANEMSDLQGLDMSSRSNLGSSNYHHNFQLPSSATSNIPGIGRYHHHIYDILSEREQSQQSQAQHQQHHSSAAAAVAAAAQHQQQEHSSQLAMQQHQSALHNMLPDQLGEQEHDQATSVDLSRTANYVVPSPPQLPYNHPHHDMLRMASLDLTPNTNMSVGNNRSFLSSQMQHQTRENLEHHRLLSTVEQHRILAASNAAAADQHRLLVDPTAHLLMEQNNRLLGTEQSRLLSESAQNRHMARGFGAYHQVASGNYHPGVRPPVLPSANHHASNPSNYHPFPAYY